ncbi:MAG TPA: 50S ribosomal protein L23 [Candidatus Bathyarchaeia archaeon]|nr:MAG: 50S ribosomal protein L23 [Candidatus Bathyarchaeota archaeon RBG_16_48_13]HJX23912.1 50S ribosomal protein L23 [Candidatus Bathyarchaeia archaeon]
MARTTINKTILYPVMTEDAISLIEAENKLVFVVSLKAGKSSIRQSIEEIYKVKVEKVNVSISNKGLKKAYIKLAPEFKASDVAIKLGIF